MLKKFFTLFSVGLFVAVLFLGIKSVQAETFSDLTVTGDARFQYPIYADGGLIQFGGGDLRMIDFDQGGSRIYNKGDLHVVTDDNLYFDFSNVSGLSLAEFASRMRVNDNLFAYFPIYARGNELVFDNGGVAVKTADGTPRIYRDTGGNLRIMGSNLHLDITNGINTANDLTVGGDFAVTGTQTYTGNTTFNGTVTINDTSSAAFWNKGETTLAGAVWLETALYIQNGSGGDAIKWSYNGTQLAIDYYDGSATNVVTITNAGLLTTAGGVTVGGALSVTGDTTLTGDLTVNGGNIDTDSVDLVIEAGTTTAKSLILISDEDSTDAINIDATAGGIDIDAVGEDGQDIDLTNTGGSIHAKATEGVVDAIELWAASGGGIYMAARDSIVHVANTYDINLNAQDDVIINADDDFNFDAADNITIDTADGSMTFTAGGADNGDISLVVGDNYTNTVTGDYSDDVAGGYTIDSDSAMVIGAAGLTVTSDGGALTLNGDGTNDIDLANTGAPLDINVGSIDADVTGQINIDSSQGSATAIVLNNSSAAGGVDINVGSGGFALDVTDGAIALSATGATAGDMTVSVADDFAVDAASYSLDSREASNVSVSTDADAEDLTISLTGATNSSILLQSSGTAADAISMSTSAGGIDITVAGAAADEDLDLTSNSSINITSTEAGVNDAIKFAVAGDSTIAVDAAAGTQTADVMRFNVSVDSASVDATYYNVDVGTALSAGETVNGINLDIDGNALDDAGSNMNGIYLTSANTTGGTNTGLRLAGAWDEGINLSAATTTAGIMIGSNSIDGNNFDVAGVTQAVTLTRQNVTVSPLTITSAGTADNTSAEIDINTRVIQGEIINIDYTADTQADAALTGIDVDFTNLTPDDDKALYGIHVNDPASDLGGSLKYGLFVDGNNWDYGIVSSTSLRFGRGQNQTIDIFAGTTDTAGKNLTVAPGAGGTATAAGQNGGALGLNGGAATDAGGGDTNGGNSGNVNLTTSNGGAAAGDGDGGDAGNIVLTTGTGGAAAGAGDSGEGGSVYLDADSFVYFGGTTAAVGDIAYDRLDDVWFKYVLNSTGGNIVQYDAVQYKVGAGADGTTVIQSNADDAASFAGIYTDDGPWATATNDWIVIHGQVGEADNGVVDSANTLADGDPFSTWGATGGAGQIHKATDAAGSVGVGGFAVDETTQANDWIVFVRAM